VRSPKPTTLVGQHVQLVPLGREHVDDLVEAAADPEIWVWTGPGGMETRAGVAAYVDAAVTDADRLPFAVMVDGRAAGSTSYGDIDLEVGGIEVGWTWYARWLWSTAVNPECKLLLLGHAFDELGAARVTLKTDGNNTRSQAAIRKLGASYDGTLRHHRLRADGSVRDSAVFSVLAAEWPAIRDGLRVRVG